MDSKELIRNYEDDIRAYENNIADLEILIRKIKQKIENQEAARNGLIKEKNRIVSLIEKNKKKSSSLSQKFPKTRFVEGVSKLLVNFEFENNSKLISSFDNDIKDMRQEILKNYELLDDYKRELAVCQNKVNYCYTEIEYLRRSK